jgi:hypothetical protein
MYVRSNVGARMVVDDGVWLLLLQQFFKKNPIAHNALVPLLSLAVFSIHIPSPSSSSYW